MRSLENSLSAILCLAIVALAASSLIHSRTGEAGPLSGATSEQTMRQAELLNNESKYAESLDLLFKAFKNDPDNSVLKSLMQKTFVMHIQSEVGTGYDRIGRDKHDVGGYLAIANAYKLNRQYSDAMKALDEGVIENPKEVLLWLNIGLLELMQGRDAEALSVYKEVLRLDGKNPIAFNNVAYVESRSDDLRLIDLKEAHVFAKKAVEAEPQNPNFLETLALIEFKRGQKSEATKLIREAIEIDPNESMYQSELETFEKGENAQ